MSDEQAENRGSAVRVQASVRLEVPRFDARAFEFARVCASGATFAPPGAGGAEPVHRYALWRNWETPLVPEPKRLLWICLNPSRADERQADPTVRRMLRFSRDWGYGGMFVANLFAYRSTFPEELGDADDPVGPWNDRMIEDLAQHCDDVLCAWGTCGVLLDRNRVVLDLLGRIGAPLWMLERTKNGHPKHPLYVAGDRRPQKFVI